MRQQRSSEKWNWQRGAMVVLELLFVMDASWSGFCDANGERRNSKLEIGKTKCET
jgi:hypothetical protein